MTKNALFGGDEFARLLGITDGKFCIYLHEGRACKIETCETVVLPADLAALSATDELVPRRASDARLLGFLREHEIEQAICDEIGPFGCVDATVKKGSVRHEVWISRVNCS